MVDDSGTTRRAVDTLASANDAAAPTTARLGSAVIAGGGVRARQEGRRSAVLTSPSRQALTLIRLAYNGRESAEEALGEE